MSHGQRWRTPPGPRQGLRSRKCDSRPSIFTYRLSGPMRQEHFSLALGKRQPLRSIGKLID